MEITTLRKKVDSLSEQYRLSRRVVKLERVNLKKCKVHLKRVTEAQKLLQEITQQIQQKVHHRIAGIVTKCIRTIFAKPYEFRIRFEKKRGRTEAKLLFVLKGHELDPLDSEGGGLIDVAAFALRLSALILTRPPLRRLLILDEPFKYLEPENRERVRDLIEELSKKLKVQFILTTHDIELEIGKVAKV